MKGILEPIEDLELAGVTTEACDLVGLLRELQPDLLVLDYAMPGIEGWTLLRRVRRVQSGLPVVLLTGSDDPRLAQEALAHGARGFVHKSADPEDMVAAFRAALAEGEPAVVEQGQSLQQVGARFGLTAPDFTPPLTPGLARISKYSGFRMRMSEKSWLVPQTEKKISSAAGWWIKYWKWV